jgi:hypothetical protein
MGCSPFRAFALLPLVCLHAAAALADENGGTVGLSVNL